MHSGLSWNLPHSSCWLECPSRGRWATSQTSFSLLNLAFIPSYRCTRYQPSPRPRELAYSLARAREIYDVTMTTTPTFFVDLLFTHAHQAQVVRLLLAAGFSKLRLLRAGAMPTTKHWTTELDVELSVKARRETERESRSTTCCQHAVRSTCSELRSYLLFHCGFWCNHSYYRADG